MDGAELTDAKVDAAEARTDAKFAFLRSEMKLMNAEISAKLDTVLTAVRATNDRVASFEGKLAQQSIDIDKKLSEQHSDIDNKLSEQRSYIDKKFSEQRSDIDKKFSEQRSDIDKRLSEQRSDIDRKLAEQASDFKADFRANRTLMIGLAISVSALMLAIVVAVFTVGNTMFSRGMNVRDEVKAITAEILQQQKSSLTPTKP